MRKQNNGKYIYAILGYIFVLWIFMSQNMLAASSEVKIQVNENKVANMYYQVVKDGKALDKIQYTMKDENGNVIYKGEADKTLFLKNVPFGDYQLIIHEGKDYFFEITLCEEYVKTQHELKVLELIVENSVRTGDSAQKLITFCLGLDISMAFLIAYIIRRRKYE